MKLIDADKVKELIKGPLSVDTDADKEYVCSLIDEIGSGWISVKDKLPAAGQNVLVYMERDAWDDHGLHYRKKDIEIGWQINDIWHCDGCSRVLGLYWIPIPEPPEVDENG